MEGFTLETQLEMAINIAVKYHANQKDKAGIPYIVHPLWVMSNVEDIKCKIAAALHDIVEDTEVTIHDLVMYGFDPDIVEAIKVLTKPKQQKYMNYIEQVNKNEIARNVKIADLKHNMDLSRLNNITDKDLKRVEKYKKAYDLLMRGL